MPLVTSTYRPGFFYKNGHINTIFASKVKPQADAPYQRKRFETPDNDFFDVDTIVGVHKKALILMHGLEGSAHSTYILEMANFFSPDYDIWAMNHRSCSGSLNLLYPSYHSGHTKDLKQLVNTLSEKYEEIYIIGVSLGGNITLKYLGDEGNKLPSVVKKVATLSVPCQLNSSAKVLQKRINLLYLQNFVISLKSKVVPKMEAFNMSQTLIDEVRSAKTFVEFDDRYTGPAHGFKDAEDYWSQCSSKEVLDRIIVPTLLINAKDDPFLSEECFPYEIAEKSEFLYLETPDYGGHVGFLTSLYKQRWYLSRIRNFLSKPI
ncbi:alpha/beta fold hydrolase [Flammeovirga sp. SubArs3]|uniref:YheT family hydrolase n=1 Tax=Flammeovirga sp. SubArs3 TaxID=2995316 RepID=UPI00248B176B|nr:alpha/beta fold hydrolase [Flammeovirga sp. SubArs3]